MGETRGSVNGQTVTRKAEPKKPESRARERVEIGPKLPACKEFEEQVISVMLEKDPEGTQAMRAFDTIAADAFHFQGHKMIAEWIQSRRAAGLPVDMIALVTDVQGNSGLATLARNAFGGDGYIGEIAGLATKAVSVAHFGYWLANIKDAWIRRKAIAALTAGIQDLYDPKGSKSEQIVADIQASLAGVTVDFNTVETEAEVVTQAVNEIEERIASGKPLGYTTGFRTLDNVMCIRPGEVIIIAAPTSVGKTTFALQIADHLAGVTGNVMFFTKEMSNAQLMHRLLAQDVGRNLDTVTKDDPAGIQQINMSASKRRNRNALHFRDTAELMNVGVIETITNVMVAKGTKAIAIDYLQLMESTKESAKKDRRMQIVDITRRIKGLARKLNIPLIMISQIERPEKGVKNWKPTLRSLSESKTIEEDADTVIFISRDLLSDQAEVKVAKQRNGEPSDWLPLNFHRGSTTFADTDQPQLPLA